MRAVLYAPVAHRLADAVREGGPLAPAQVGDIAVQLLDALKVLHEAGVVHGDLHPGTVELHADGRATLLLSGARSSATATTDGDLIALGATLFAATGGWPGPLRPVIEALLSATSDDPRTIAAVRSTLAG